MKVMSYYYGPTRYGYPVTVRDYPGCRDMEAEIRVEIEGRQYGARATHDSFSRVPEYVVRRNLEDQLMHEIRKELFGR